MLSDLLLVANEGEIEAVRDAHREEHVVQIENVLLLDLSPST